MTAYTFFLFFNGGTVENKRFQMTNKCHESWKSKVLQDAPAKLWSSLFLVTRTMQVLFVLRFYHPDKTDKTDKRDFPSLPPPPKKVLQLNDVAISGKPLNRLYKMRYILWVVALLEAYDVTKHGRHLGFYQELEISYM